MEAYIGKCRGGPHDNERACMRVQEWNVYGPMVQPGAGFAVPPNARVHSVKLGSYLWMDGWWKWMPAK